MYGNERLPGIGESAGYRPEGTIWRGAVQSTWFKHVRVAGGGAETVKIPLGTIMKEAPDGTYVVMEEAEILTGTAGLPGARLAVVADSTGRTGTVETVEGASGPETVEKPWALLVGIMGEVDQDRLIVGGKKWGELTDEQRRGLRTQMEAWNFSPVHVTQA